MYEPSGKIRKQIAQEFQKLQPDCKVCDVTAMHRAGVWSNLPTIKKALELYENRPQWQDKPDKEGWWWRRRDDEECYGNEIYYVHESVTGVLVSDNLLLANDLRDYDWGKNSWLNIPEPEPYKGDE